MWREGRAWLHIRPEYAGEEKGKPSTKPRWYSGNVCFAWKIPGRHPGVSVDVGSQGDEDNLSLHVGFLLADLWLTFEHMGTQYLSTWLIPAKDYEGRETGIRFFNQAVWWDVWHPSMSWTRGTPRWRHGSWHPLDTFFGRLERSSETLEEAYNVPVPLPEGTYRADVTLSRNTWTRSRWPHWPFGLVVDGAEVKMHEGLALPIPGKGENAYDCGDDATYSLYLPHVATVEEAIGRAVADTLRTRKQRQGDYGWREAPDTSGTPVQSIVAPEEDV
jgi:hypothetical protein